MGFDSYCFSNYIFEEEKEEMKIDSRLINLTRDRFTSIIEITYDKESPSYIFERILGFPSDLVLFLFLYIYSRKRKK